MSKIFFSNKQYQKLYELLYLGAWMKTANYAPQEEGYDKSSHDLLDYVEKFAKDHGMGEFLNSKGEFNAEYDDLMHPIIEEFNETTMYDELAEKLAFRDFEIDHKQRPKFDIGNSEQDEYDKRYVYREKYDNEFEEYGLERLRINGNI